jgi:iron complex transport system ATP-binding protein
MTLRGDQLSLTLGQQSALITVSAEIKPGRVTAVLGPNGAGKSSLARVLAGLVAPQSGHVTLNGLPLSAIAAAERARKIGYLAQNGDPAWHVTARDLVSLGRHPHRHRFAALSSQDNSAIDAAMVATDTLHLAERTVDAVSGGERARIQMARVLATGPQWIIVDEPLANLDPPHQRDMLALLKSAAQAGAGVMMIVHQINAAARVADDIILMREGRVIASGAADTTLTATNLELAFGIGFDLIKNGDARIFMPKAD